MYLAVGVAVHVTEDLSDSHRRQFPAHEAVLKRGHMSCSRLELYLTLQGLHDFVDFLLHAGTACEP